MFHSEWSFSYFKNPFSLTSQYDRNFGGSYVEAFTAFHSTWISMYDFTSQESWSERAESAKRKLSSRKAEREGRGLSINDNATSLTNLTSSDGKYAKYSRFDTEGDRVELLSAADYDANSLSSSYNTTSGYGISPSSRAPKNIFDDL